MTSKFPGIAHPSAGFDEPIEMLKACHERILRFSELLIKLTEHVKVKGVDEEAERVAKQIQHYFATSGQLHHMDEEDDLFPMIKGIDQTIDALLSELRTEHNQLDALWGYIDPVLLAPVKMSDSSTLGLYSTQLYEIYRTHIRKENEELFPFAQKILSKEQCQQLGKRMTARRES